MSSRPVTVEFDYFSPEFRADPSSLIAALRLADRMTAHDAPALVP